MLLFSSGKPKRWLSLIMSILMVNTVLITSLPSKSLVAALENDPGSSVPENSMACEIVDFRALFDQLDQKGGDWYKNYNNEAGYLAFREAYVMQAYLLMYETYRDTCYLEKFIEHADSVLKQRDSVRGVTDYRGLSLPAWRRTNEPGTPNPLILDGRYAHLVVETASIAYPFAWFARIVKNDPELCNYERKADIYVRAAADAVAVHDDEWRESGEEGCYIFRKGSPYWCDGVGVPFNQNLGMARTLLKIWQATGEAKYLDRITRIARHFQEHLTLAADCYVWNYWYGHGYNGWSVEQQVSDNTPSYGGYKKYEDFRHGAVAADFVVLAYQAGIAFTEDVHIYRFARTLENNLIRGDGGINEFVSGLSADGGSSMEKGNNSILIGLWMRYHRVAPSLFDNTCQQVAGLSTVGAPGLLVVAYLNWASKNRIPKTPGSYPQNN